MTEYGLTTNGLDIAPYPAPCEYYGDTFMATGSNSLHMSESSSL